MTDPGTALSVPVSVDRSLVKQMDLGVEAPTALKLDIWADRLEDFTSAHAPFGLPGGRRLNIAARDEAFREESLETVREYIRATAAFPRCAIINMHAAPKRWNAPQQGAGHTGDYALLVEGLRALADLAGSLDRTLVVENNRAYWDGIGDDEPIERCDRSGCNEYYATTPEELLGLYGDVEHERFALCVDSSHVATYLETLPDAATRQQQLMSFLARPEVLAHFHWNGNYMNDVRGRQDQHLSIGEGTLPAEFHRAIKALPIRKVLEHDHGPEALGRELEFIAAL